MTEPPDIIHVKLDKPLHLTARGAWLHGGEPFTNLKVAALFTRSVVFDPQQGAWLVAISAQRAAFTFEDTPVFVEDIDEQGIAHFSSSAFLPTAPEAYSLKVGADGAWHLYTEAFPLRSARLMPSLQQRLTALICEHGDKTIIELSRARLEIVDGK